MIALCELCAVRSYGGSDMRKNEEKVMGGHTNASLRVCFSQSSYSSERISALVVGHWRADQVWEQGSTRAGNRTAVGQWAHHRHGNNVVVVVLHAHGMHLHVRTICL